MNQPDSIFEKTIHIHTFECDVNRKWKPAAFFQHLSEAAGLHADILGCGFETMLSQNLYWVHSRMKIKFHRFPEAEEQVTIRTWPKIIQQKLFFIRDYILLDAAGEEIAAASSAWLIINAQTRRLVMPQSVNLDLPSHSDEIGLAEPLEKLPPVFSPTERLRAKAGYSAVDLLGHVNNSRYVEWICDTFPIEMYSQNSLDWLQINYEREIRPGEEVAVLSAQSREDSDLWALEGQNLTSGTRSFEAQVKWKKNNVNSNP